MNPKNPKILQARELLEARFLGAGLSGTPGSAGVPPDARRSAPVPRSEHGVPLNTLDRLREDEGSDLQAAEASQEFYERHRDTLGRRLDLELREAKKETGLTADSVRVSTDFDRDKSRRDEQREQIEREIAALEEKKRAIEEGEK
jgi:hypothetical protein